MNQLKKASSEEMANVFLKHTKDAVQQAWKSRFVGGISLVFYHDGDLIKINKRIAVPFGVEEPVIEYLQAMIDHYKGTKELE
jgi:hypothetical protein